MWSTSYYAEPASWLTTNRLQTQLNWTPPLMWMHILAKYISELLQRRELTESPALNYDSFSWSATAISFSRSPTFLLSYLITAALMRNYADHWFITVVLFYRAKRTLVRMSAWWCGEENPIGHVLEDPPPNPQNNLYCNWSTHLLVNAGDPVSF